MTTQFEKNKYLFEFSKSTNVDLMIIALKRIEADLKCVFKIKSKSS